MRGGGESVSKILFSTLQKVTLILKYVTFHDIYDNEKMYKKSNKIMNNCENVIYYFYKYIIN